MLSRKHFNDFADLFVKLQANHEFNINSLVRDIELSDNPTKTAEIVKTRLTDNFNDLYKEVCLILDKNSLRFNKYKFKNYILNKLKTNANYVFKQSEVNNELNK